MPISPSKHSKKYSPSKSATWINCPLSTVLNTSSGESNPQAEFGTQTHELSAALISKSLNIVDYEHGQKPIEELVKELSMYSDDMQEIAERYADYVVGTVLIEKNRSDREPLVVVETHLDMPFDADAGGTLDFGMISSYKGGTLTVIDLKTGRLAVSAGNIETGEFNTQLGIYALYLYKAYKDVFDVKNVRLVVYQPVIANTNDYEMSIDDLLRFETEVLLPAVERTKVENPIAKSGSYCKYCAGKAVCRERMESNMNIIKDTKTPPNTLSDAEIERVLPYLDDLISYAEDVKEFCLKRAVKGHRWSGFKLVHGKAVRKIMNEDAVIRICTEEGIDPYASRKLAGVTELAKRMGKERFNELIGGYISRQEGFIQLVPKNDTREEVIINLEGDKKQC